MQTLNLSGHFDCEKYISDPTYREYALQTHVEQVNAFDIINNFVERVRKCSCHEDYYLLQNDLGQYIEHIDKMIGFSNQERKKAKVQQKKMKRRKNDLDGHKIIQEKKNEIIADYKYEVYKRISRQARYIGDAMAWRLYECDIRAIHALGLNDSHGPIPDSEHIGARTEKDTIEKLWKEDNVFALRHDYTNCLRISDISIFYPHKKNIAHVEEIKAKQKDARSNQKKIRARMFRLVRKSVSQLQDGSMMIQSVQKNSASDLAAIEENFSLFSNTLQQAATEGIGFASNGYVEIFAYTIDKLEIPMVKNKIVDWISNERPFLAINPTINSNGVVVVSSMLKVINSQFGVPYTLFPIPPDYVAALITGSVRVEMKLNTRALTEKLRQYDLEVENMFMQDREDPSILVKIDRDVFQIGWHALEQVVFESMPLEILAASLKESHQLHKAVIKANSEHNIVTTFDCIALDYAAFWNSSSKHTRN